VPQWQKSKGCLIITAALELSGNQVTHFYSKKKNTAEMIRLMETLIDQYRDRRKIYLSWDAASWHVSKHCTKVLTCTMLLPLAPSSRRHPCHQVLNSSM